LIDGLGRKKAGQATRVRRTSGHISRTEFMLGVLSYLGVLTFGVLPGVAAESRPDR
jgi:hypothetical protein